MIKNITVSAATATLVAMLVAGPAAVADGLSGFTQFVLGTTNVKLGQTTTSISGLSLVAPDIGAATGSKAVFTGTGLAASIILHNTGTSGKSWRLQSGDDINPALWCPGSEVIYDETGSMTYLTVATTGVGIDIGPACPIWPLEVGGGMIGVVGDIPTATGTGTPVISARSTDTGGEITGGTSATSIVLTFSAAKAHKPFCGVWGQNVVITSYTPSTTGISIVIPATTGAVVNYVCIQN